jgi:uncharacterized protein (TIGR02246 family)
MSAFYLTRLTAAPHGSMKKVQRVVRAGSATAKVTRMSVLEDKDTIREVMAAYCHALDSGRFAEVASLFADDAVWTTDYGEAKGPKAIEEMFRSVVPLKGEGPQRKHYITNIIIKVDGDRASSISDYLVVREKGPDLIPVMGGTYKDQWIRQGGTWRFWRKELQHDIAGDMALKNKR